MPARAGPRDCGPRPGTGHAPGCGGPRRVAAPGVAAGAGTERPVIGRPVPRTPDPLAAAGRDIEAVGGRAGVGARLQGPHEHPGTALEVV